MANASRCSATSGSVGLNPDKECLNAINPGISPLYYISSFVQLFLKLTFWKVLILYLKILRACLNFGHKNL